MESPLSICGDDTEPIVAGVLVGLHDRLVEQAEVDDGTLSVNRRDTEDAEQEMDLALPPAVANPVSRRVYGHGRGGASGVKNKRKKKHKLTVDDPPPIEPCRPATFVVTSKAKMLSQKENCGAWKRRRVGQNNLIRI